MSCPATVIIFESHWPAPALQTSSNTKPPCSPSACCSSAPICCLVKHEHYVCCDCITPAARPASLCSAAVWRFKDLGLVLRNMFTILPKSDRLCHQICKHRRMVKSTHAHIHTDTLTHWRSAYCYVLYLHYTSFSPLKITDQYIGMCVHVHKELDITSTCLFSHY